MIGQREENLRKEIMALSAMLFYDGECSAHYFNISFRGKKFTKWGLSLYRVM